MTSVSEFEATLKSDNEEAKLNA
jgi:hypothetical protein